MEYNKISFAAETVNKYMKPVYKFVCSKIASIEDAKDLTQEICIKLYRSLCLKEDIINVNAFVWTVARNALANYYRDKTNEGDIDDFSNILTDMKMLPEEQVVYRENIAKMQYEIAYLSKTQRRVIIEHFYNNRKIKEIAELLNIPIGTVKWHLSEAKQSLRKGMETVRSSSNLKFNPIRFVMMGANGKIGSMGGTANFFRSVLSQNIVYCIRKEAKTINEIADDLGVSPVYIESEIEFLEEYCFVIRDGKKYIANILIEEPTTELNKMHDEMYLQGARLIGNELFDEIMNSDIWDSDEIYIPGNDKNFAMWSLLFYAATFGGEALFREKEKVSFEEAATMRPDGGYYIPLASVINPDSVQSEYCMNMNNWSGPCWKSSDKHRIWFIDSEWTGPRISDYYIYNNIEHDIDLLYSWVGGKMLSENDYAHLSKRGYISIDENHHVTSNMIIAKKSLLNKVIEIADDIKSRHWDELCGLTEDFVNKCMKETPKHLRKMRMYGLQYIFYSDAWLALYMAKEFTKNGKLKLPTEEQKKMLSMMLEVE